MGSSVKDSAKKMLQALKIKDDHSLDKDEVELLSLSLDIVKAYTDQLKLRSLRNNTQFAY